MTHKRIATRLAATAATVALATLTVAAPAAAATTGSTAFYLTTTYTDVPRVVDYAACDGHVSMLAGHFAATDNRPPLGCMVQISSNISGWLTLCRGRAELPPTVRYTPTIRAVPGFASLCPAGPWS